MTAAVSVIGAPSIIAQGTPTARQIVEGLRLNRSAGPLAAPTPRGTGSPRTPGEKEMTV